MGARYRIGFDIGGTFTDFILLDQARSQIRLHKCLTTPSDPSIGALQGLEELVAAASVPLADVAEIVHGTTLVTNALIERTRRKARADHHRGFPRHPGNGYRAALRYLRPVPALPRPLVPRRRRLEVPERMDRDGNAVTPLDREAVRTAARSWSPTASRRSPSASCTPTATPRMSAPPARSSARCSRYGRLAVLGRGRGAVGIPALVTTCANAFVQPLMDPYVRSWSASCAQRGFRGALI